MYLHSYWFSATCIHVKLVIRRRGFTGLFFKSFDQGLDNETLRLICQCANDTVFMETCGQLGEECDQRLGRKVQWASEAASEWKGFLSFRITTRARGFQGVQLNFSNGEPSPWVGCKTKFGIIFLITIFNWDNCFNYNIGLISVIHQHEVAGDVQKQNIQAGWDRPIKRIQKESCAQESLAATITFVSAILGHPSGARVRTRLR